MTREEHIPWPWLLLGILDDSRGQAALRDIYTRIEEQQYHEMEKECTELIKSRLFEIDPRHGIRPKYQHTVRGCLSNYKKRGLVERIDKATYRLTDAGLNHLKWHKEHF